MMKKFIAAASLIIAQSLFAADSPVGQWKTIDDETKKAKSIVEITQNVDGTLSGKVIQLLKNPGAVCKKCDGTKKDQPIEGMEILWGLTDQGDKWSEGEILDPAKGKTYRVELKVTDGGAKLNVTGKLLMFSRTQVWLKN